MWQLYYAHSQSVKMAHNFFFKVTLSPYNRNRSVNENFVKNIKSWLENWKMWENIYYDLRFTCYWFLVTSFWNCMNNKIVFFCFVFISNMWIIVYFIVYAVLCVNRKETIREFTFDTRIQKHFMNFVWYTYNFINRWNRSGFFSFYFHSLLFFIFFLWNLFRLTQIIHTPSPINLKKKWHPKNWLKIISKCKPLKIET